MRESTIARHVASVRIAHAAANVAAKRFRIECDLLVTRTRVKPMDTARALAYLLARRSGATVKGISHVFHVDHSAVVHTSNTFADRLAKRPRMQATFDQLLEAVREETRGHA